MAILIKPISFPLAIWSLSQWNVLDIFHLPIQLPSLPFLCPRMLASIDCIKRLLISGFYWVWPIWGIGRSLEDRKKLTLGLLFALLFSCWLTDWLPSSNLETLFIQLPCVLCVSVLCNTTSSWPFKLRVLTSSHCYMPYHLFPSIKPFL